jgi:hypothetical protein
LCSICTVAIVTYVTCTTTSFAGLLEGLASACSGLAAFLQQQQQQQTPPQTNPAVAQLLSPATVTQLLAVWAGVVAGWVDLNNLSGIMAEACLLKKGGLLPTLAPACQLAAAAFRYLPGTLDNAAGMATAAAAPAAAAALPANTGSSSGGGNSSSSSSWSWRPQSSTAELTKQVVRVSSYVSVLMFKDVAVQVDAAVSG